MSITETTLEMHFHRPLMDLIRSTFGLGMSGSMNFYKYSTQRECFVGFDQAYAKSELNSQEFFTLLSRAARNTQYRLPFTETFLGYFLQFKVGRTMSRRSRSTPPQITNRPHYRFSLDTAKNANSGQSQHELLFNLKQNRGALVYYACPMVFDRAELYEIDVDLAKLRLADVADCPSSYSDNAKHHIFFDDVASDPVWCSEPKEGRAIGPEKFAQLVRTALSETAPIASAQGLLGLFEELSALGQDADYRRGPASVDASLTIVRWSTQR